MYIFNSFHTEKNMPSREIDNRSEARYPLCEKVEYVLSEYSDETLQGLAINISNSGLCLHLYHTLDKGTSIIFKSSLGNSCQKAILQWINKMESGLYKAGFGGC